MIIIIQYLLSLILNVIVNKFIKLMKRIIDSVLVTFSQYSYKTVRSKFTLQLFRLNLRIDALFMTLLIQVCQLIWMMYDGTANAR